MGLLLKKLLAYALLAGIAVVARYLHEATHYLVAWLLGRRPRYNWPFGEVAWIGGDDPPDAGDRIIALAPQAVGIVALVAVVTVGWASLLSALALLIYVATGGRKDYQIGLKGHAPAPEGQATGDGAQAAADGGEATPDD